ncbi:lipoprotein [Pasteurella oralis]|uniref:Lipoprotein n=1 Tax=Pasteurella oralis TaxID=1071947 RepID=A0ABW4NRC3_9PAST|nr:lipoprotein [Pasteurella oralis]
MKKWVSAFVLAALCVLTVSCGVKGPLYFPEKEQAQDTVK